MAAESLVSSQTSPPKPARTRRLRYGTPIVVFTASPLMLAWALNRNPRAIPSALIGQPVPQFASPPVKGRTLGFSNANLIGEVSLVNFFASWCVEFRAEHPLLLRLKNDAVVPIHGLNYKGSLDDAAKWLDTFGDPYTRTGADLSGRVAIDWGVYGVPETFVITMDGHHRADRPHQLGTTRKHNSSSDPEASRAMTLGMRSNLFLSVAWVSALLIAMTVADIRAAQALPENSIVHNTPKAVASIRFEDEGGRTRSLADFKGKAVVLNIWATWCVPCRREMPALDRLQAAVGGPDLEVVPVSIDRGGIDAVRKFYAEINVRSLAVYVDKSGQILRDVGAVGLPTTLIVNRNGEEIGRVVGPAEWDTAEIMQFLRSIAATRADDASGISPTDNPHVAEKNPHAPGATQHGLPWLTAAFGK